MYSKNSSPNEAVRARMITSLLGSGLVNLGIVSPMDALQEKYDED